MKDQLEARRSDTLRAKFKACQASLGQPPFSIDAKFKVLAGSLNLTNIRVPYILKFPNERSNERRKATLLLRNLDSA